ncbi:MAG: hypothetical protein H6581_26250 [Bacteroidia bacterium]|nr:hypothetical protein [Bacteroidia bacterium]
MRQAFFTILFFLIAVSAFSQYKYRAYKIEPGIYVFPLKSWWDANGPVEIGSLGVGVSLAYKFNRAHGFESGLLFVYQQGIEQVLPCHSAPQPCPPVRTHVPFLKIPLFWRYTYDINSKVVLKTQVGPQIGLFTGSQPNGNPYKRVVPEIAGGFEMNHKLSEAFYITYGFRFDVGLINPENPHATKADGSPYFETGRKNGHYYNTGLVLGFNILWERYK